MSVARPTGYLDWVTSNNPAYIQQPTSGQQNTGWVLNEAPPFEYMNWNENLTDQWIKYFDFVLTGGATSIAAESVVLVTTGNLAIGSNVILALASTAGLVPGLSVTGTGVPAGAYITSVGSGTVAMSVNATSNQTADALTFSHTFATGTTVQAQLDELDAELNLAVKDSTDLITSPIVLQTTGTTTNGNDALTVLASTTGLIAGLSVTGAGIPAGAYLISVGVGTATMNVPATASAAGVALTFQQTYAVGSNVHAALSELDAQTNLITKDPKNITASTVVATFIGAAVVGGSPVMTGITSTANLRAGMLVTGSGLGTPYTYVQTILSGTSVLLNKPATATGATNPTFSHAFATGTDVQTQLDQIDAALNGTRDQVSRIAGPATVTIDTASSELGQSGFIVFCDPSAGSIIINLPTAATVPEGFRFRVQTGSNTNASRTVTLHRVGAGNINDGGVDFVIKAALVGCDVQWSQADNSWYTSYPERFLAKDGTAALPGVGFRDAQNTGMYRDTLTGALDFSTAGVKRLSVGAGQTTSVGGFFTDDSGTASSPTFGFTDNNSGMFNDAGSPGFIGDGGADTLVRTTADGLVSGSFSSPIRWQKYDQAVSPGLHFATTPAGSRVLSMIGMWNHLSVPDGDFTNIPMGVNGSEAGWLGTIKVDVSGSIPDAVNKIFFRNTNTTTANLVAVIFYTNW